MIKSIFQKLLLKSGKNYEIDQNIPSSFFINNIRKRIIMTVRGILKMKKRVFIGNNVKISNKKNIILGKNVTFDNHVTIDGYAKEKIIFGNNVTIGQYSKLMCTSHPSKLGKGFEIGNNSSCGQFTEFGSAGGVKIGNDVIMGSFISFHSENHNFEDPKLLIREQGVNSKGIEIGNNVWVGAKVTFLDGAKIGNNTIIAAGAVVNKEFPDNVIIGGIPAKIIKSIY